MGGSGLGMVEDGVIPCCFLLGSNFLAQNKLEIDFGDCKVGFRKDEGRERFVVNATFMASDVYTSQV